MDVGLKLFITHLPLEWTQKMVTDYFQAYGRINSVHLFQDSYGSRVYLGLGCAYVVFNIKSEAEETMAKLNHSQVIINKNKMRLRWADGESERLHPPDQVAFAEYITKDGRSYYWNSVTGQTQWNRPKNAYIIPRDQTTQSNELFVFYLPSEWTDDDLRDHFERFGEIVNSKIAYDKNTNKSKGFAFVTFVDSVSAANAVQAMNGFQVLGKRLKVQFKKNSSE